MAKTIVVPTRGIKSLSTFLNSDQIKNKFTEIMGKKGVGFISSVLSAVNSNSLLQNADQNSIYTAALMAATLDLPINQNLGLAYIIGYNTKQADGSYKVMAQFQIGYKGFKQLAMRSGQFKTLHETVVKEGEIINHDRLTGSMKFNWIQDSSERLSKKTIGYISYFELLNGFSSIFYMTKEEAENHGKKYSQNYKKYGTGLWKDEFDAMALKTVIKLNLSKNAPLSIEMQQAVLSDQGVIKSDDFLNNPETLDVDHVDNTDKTKIEKIQDQKQLIKDKGTNGKLDLK